MSNIIFEQAPTSYNLIIYPNGDSSVALQRYPTSPATNYDKVDDVSTVPNDDVDYVYCNTIPPSILDMYTFTDYTTETGLINYIQVFTRAKAYPVGQSLTGEYKHKITCLTGNALSSNYAPVTTAYQPYSTIWTTRPADGLAWTWTDINALIAGVSVSSPLITNYLQLILRPNAAGDLTENIPVGAASNYLCVDEETADDTTTYVKNASTGYKTDLYHVPNHTTETGTITGVTVVSRDQKIAAGVWGKSSEAVKIGGTVYYSGERTLSAAYNNYSTAWATNPAGGSWTWTNIDDLQIGVRLNLEVSGGGYFTACTQVYAIVDYNISQSPQIRTTQQYVIVNYSPNPSTVTLLAPSEARYSNQRRTERFIFPDGTYCIGDYGRASKTMTLTGSETTNAIQKMRQVQAMLNIPAPVTISGLLDVNQDIPWRLKNFDYEYDIGGDHYDWTAELCAYDEVG